MNSELFIVVHTLELIDDFKHRNKYLCENFNIKYILVGNNHKDIMPITSKIIIPCQHEDNIEEHESLLTFTAWYFLAKNPQFVTSNYVGIFEYDTDISSEIFNLKLEPLKLIGFNPRSCDEQLYLGKIKGFTDLLSDEEYENALIDAILWNATTNVIMSFAYLQLFVDWYITFIPQIFEYKNHPHYHERAINVCANSTGMEFRFFPHLVKHYEKRSHGIEL